YARGCWLVFGAQGWPMTECITSTVLRTASSAVNTNKTSRCHATVSFPTLPGCCHERRQQIFRQVRRHSGTKCRSESSGQAPTVGARCPFLCPDPVGRPLGAAGWAHWTSDGGLHGSADWCGRLGGIRVWRSQSPHLDRLPLGLQV